MREFGISFGPGLYKGLRAFPSPKPGNEELIECYNIAPSEHALRGYAPLLPLGFTAPFVEYFAIKDQGGVVWYWISGPDLTDIHSTTIPVVSTYGYVGVDVTPATIPYWLQVDAADNLSTQLYIFPGEINGDILVDTTHPSVGTGYDVLTGLTLRSIGGWRHKLSALSLDLVAFWSRIGE